jgi:hypothetical protein
VLSRLSDVFRDAIKGEPRDSLWDQFFWTAVGFAVVLPASTVFLGGFSMGASLVFWIFAGIFLCVALEMRKRANRRDHRASVTHVIEDTGRSYYYAMCDCGWVDVPIDSREKAFADARKHSKRVADEVVERTVRTS